jgi:hypothetical protein
LQDAADGVALLLEIEAGEVGRIGGAVAHELPTALLHLLHGFRVDLADLRVQRDGGFDAGFVEHVGKAPQPDAQPVFPPGIIEDVGHVVGGIGGNAHANGGIVVPDLHVGRKPDGKRIVARPFERLAFGNEGIVIALRPADRPRRRLGPGAHR